MSVENLGIKYRPRIFSEIVGQEHVVKTLTNAVESGKIGHAYLFAGPRGTGKTSTARILAKALNCKYGPTPNPCNECEFCTAINNGSSLDVQEIDGASNNSVEDIRSLRENVKYIANSRYKIYIIDEVHMLSKGAFNALLKTLEEPPENVVFIFATTEPNKVLPTIISRCQRLDFNLIPTKLIYEHLKKICEKEGIVYEDDALFEISKAGRGSIRDALSILGQIATYTESNITTEAVRKILNIISYDLVYDLINSIIHQEAERAITLFEDAYQKGYDVAAFCADLLKHLRNLLLIKNVKEPHLVVEESDEYISKMQSIANTVTTGVLLNIIETLSNYYPIISRSNIPRIIFETALLKITQPTKTVQLTQILRKIDELERLLLNANIPAPAPTDTTQTTRSNEETTSTKSESTAQEIPTTAANNARQKSPENAAINLENIKHLFKSQIVPRITEKNAAIGNLLRETDIIELKNNTIVLAVPERWFGSIRKPKIREMIISTMNSVLGAQLSLALRKISEAKQQELPDVIEDPTLIKELVSKDNTVQEVLDIFGGEVEKIVKLK